MDTLVEDLLAFDPKLRRIAARLAADPEEANDLVQEVWVALLTKWPGPSCAVRPWALQVLRNQAARRGRRLRAIDSEPELERAADTSNDGVPPAESRETALRLRACIESLPEPYRGTLKERFYSGRSVGDIAAARGMPRATVSTHLHRALERLRARLGRANEFLGIFPFARAWKRGAEFAALETTRRLVLVRSLAFACTLAPVVVAVAWVGAPGAESESSVELDETAASAPSVAARTREDEPSARVALSFPPEPAHDSLRVHVQDAESKAPLGGRRIRVWSEDGALHERETDARGACALPRELATQWLTVAVDSGRDARASATSETFRFFARAEAGELRLESGGGPLLLARIRTPRDLHAAELVHGLRSQVPGALTSPRLKVGPGKGPSVWTLQLPSQWSGSTDFAAASLYVGTQDGLLGAEARITAESLALRETLVLELESRAALSVTIRSPRDETLETGVIRLVPEGSDAAWIAGPSSSGRAWIPGLLPGKVAMEVVMPGTAPWTRELELRGGVHESVIAEMLPRSERVAIRGRIVRARDAYDGAVIVALEGGRVPQFARAKWSECADGFEARFEFPEVDVGRRCLRPIALDGLPSFEPAILEVSELLAADSSFEFTCRGERASSPIELDVRSAIDGAPVAELELGFTLAGGTIVHYRRVSASSWSVSAHDLRWKTRSGTPWDWMESGSEVQWTLTAPGFESASGDERAWSSGTLDVRLEAELPTATARSR